MNQSTSAASPSAVAPSRPSALSKSARTVGEAFALLWLSLFAMVLLKLLNARFFMPSQDQAQDITLALGQPIKFFLLAVLVAPVVEELIFRGIPGLLMRFATKPQTRARHIAWMVFGLASSLLFASMHGMQRIGTPPHQIITFQTLPLPQFLVGLWAWRVATQRGLQYSMLLHATYNLIPFMLSLQATRFLKP